MKFGKRLQTQIEQTLPEWREKFLSYKPLKKRLKQISAPDCFTQVRCHESRHPYENQDRNSHYAVDCAVRHDRKERNGLSLCGGQDGRNMYPSEQLAESETELRINKGKSDSENLTGDLGLEDVNNADMVSVIPNDEFVSETGVERPESRPLTGEEANFINLLNEELDKFNTFFIEKEEEFVIRLQDLKERIEGVKGNSKSDGRFPSEANVTDDIINIQKDIVAFHGEMVLLENYSSLNFTGLVKLLKKYEKRTGALLLLAFTQIVLRQPFLTTELLSKLVYECEDNLKNVFPLPIHLETGDCEPNPSKELTNGGESQEAPLLQGEDVQSIYQSTMAALKTIKDLREGSSTYNAFSLSPFGQSDNEEDSKNG